VNNLIKEVDTIVYIVGFMGAGKTTLSEVTARKWNITLYDTDFLLEKMDKSPVYVQLKHDLDYFRHQEAELVSQLSRLARGIISLGGGAIENVNTRSLLNGKPVVFLDPGVDVCWQRVQADTANHRPLATDYDSFVALYNKRLPLYLSVCRWHVTDNLPPEQLVHKLEALIRQG